MTAHDADPRFHSWKKWGKMRATAMGVSGVAGLALLAATATLAHGWLNPVPGGTGTHLPRSPALQRKPEPLATPILVSRTGPGFFTYRPLYATRLADRPVLRRIGQALVTARRSGPPPTQPMWPGPPTPTLAVVLANGQQVSLGFFWVRNVDFGGFPIETAPTRASWQFVISRDGHILGEELQGLPPQ